MKLSLNDFHVVNHSVNSLTHCISEDEVSVDSYEFQLTVSS